MLIMKVYLSILLFICFSLHTFASTSSVFQCSKELLEFITRGNDSDLFFNYSKLLNANLPELYKNKIDGAENIILKYSLSNKEKQGLLTYASSEINIYFDKLSSLKNILINTYKDNSALAKISYYISNDFFDARNASEQEFNKSLMHLCDLGHKYSEAQGFPEGTPTYKLEGRRATSRGIIAISEDFFREKQYDKIMNLLTNYSKYITSKDKILLKQCLNDCKRNMPDYQTLTIFGCNRPEFCGEFSPVNPFLNKIKTLESEIKDLHEELFNLKKEMSFLRSDISYCKPTPYDIIKRME